MSCGATAAPILAAYQFAGPVFLHAFQTFLTAQCLLVGDHLWPADSAQAVHADPQFDFIVVGAGSAGSVLANRLTEVPEWKVLLIEAGGNPTLTTEIPILYSANFGTDEDWGYRNQPQNNACLSYRLKTCYWPRGKTLGGTSSINGAFYTRGNKADYDDWAAAGNTGWSYEEVLPYFKKSENFSAEVTADTEKYHGFGGYLNVVRASYNETQQIVVNGFEELGLKVLYDYNGEEQMGVTTAFNTMVEGRRMSTAKAFLTPIRDRENLFVIKNALVTKLIFKDNTTKVIGVEIKKDGEISNVYADKEVVVSAGTINTPQLLLLSGIGPQDHLNEKGIEVKIDLPVGENLQDHVMIPVFFKSSQIEMTTELSDVASTVFQFIFNGTGLFSGLTPSNTFAFVNLTDSTSTSPEFQYHNMFYGKNSANMADVFKKQDVSDEFSELFNEINADNTVLSAYAGLLYPKSRGKIILNSSNPEDYPLIYANFFDDDDDLQMLVKGVQFGMKLADTQAFKDVGFEQFWLDLDACKEYEKGSDDHVKCWIREATFTIYHPVGTAKMGPKGDETAVVTPDLKVVDAEGLRVIDASVMRTIVRGNTNAPTIMIAEKGADLIKNEWLDE